LKRGRPTRNLLLLALGVSALVTFSGIALATTVQVTKEIPSTVDVIEVEVISGDNLVVSYHQDGIEPVTSLEITLVELQTPLDNLGWNQFIYLRNDSEEIRTIITPCVHVRDEITDLQIGFGGLYEHNGSGHACDNNWTIDGGETAQGTSVRLAMLSPGSIHTRQLIPYRRNSAGSIGSDTGSSRSADRSIAIVSMRLR